MGSVTTHRYVKAGRYNEYSWFSSFMFFFFFLKIFRYANNPIFRIIH